MNFSFKKNIIIIVIAAVLALGIGGTVVGVNVFNSPGNRVSRYLGEAERYLSEMNYEQAVIEFKNILKIEPMNVDAYLELADAYIGMGDKEKALEVLRPSVLREAHNACNSPLPWQTFTTGSALRQLKIGKTEKENVLSVTAGRSDSAGGCRERSPLFSALHLIKQIVPGTQIILIEFSEGHSPLMRSF